jgi:hypothetical protein
MTDTAAAAFDDSAIPDDIDAILDRVTEFCVDTAVDHILSKDVLDQIIEADISIRKAAPSEERISATQSLINDMKYRASLIEWLCSFNAEQLNAIERDFINQRQQIVPSVEERKDIISAEVNNMKAQSREWLTAFMEKVRSEIHIVQTTARASELSRYFQFYMMDTTKQAMMACLREHTEILRNETVDISKGLQKEAIVEAATRIDRSIAESVPDLSWTGLDSVLFTMKFVTRYANEAVGLALFANPFGMLFSPAFGTVFSIVSFVDATVIPLTTLVTGLLRQGLAEKKKDEYLTAFLRGYSSITRETLEGVDFIYGTIRANLNQQLDAYYQFQVDGMLDAVQQVKGLLVKGDTGVDEIRSRSQAMIAGVDKMRLLLPDSGAE